MTTRKELAQRLTELPTFNLRFGSRVDIFNLPTEDRDLIVRSLQEADDYADKGQTLTAEFERLREKILAVTIERDELGGKCRTLATENAKLEERRRTMAAEQARLEEKCRGLEAGHAPIEEKMRNLTAEHSALEEKIRKAAEERARLAADNGRLEERIALLTIDLDDAVDRLVGLVNNGDDAVAAVSWLKAKHPGKAADARPIASAASGWRPIASAPKDNAPVNLIGQNPTGRWVEPVASRRNMISADAGIDQWLDWEHPFAPTHWSPIPLVPVPASSAEKDAGKPAERAGSDRNWLQEDLRFLSSTNRR